MKKIVLVVFDDGTDKKVKNIKPLVKVDNPVEQWRENIKYNNQFRQLEEDVLEAMDQDVVKDYALEWFDVTENNEIEDKDISDFCDSELMEEVISRGLLGERVSVTQQLFIERFQKIMGTENFHVLDRMLAIMEKRLQLDYKS